MTHPALSFKLIDIRRMPGFPKGDLEIDDLCPGVNVIYGPNASGKTTLGKAIHRLLRPLDAPHDNVSLRTTLELNDVSMLLDYDMGHVKCQRASDGADVDCPKLAPPEIADRHVLALHDLVNSERDHDLAQDIAIELAGGYDVTAASASLGFSDRPSGTGNPTRDHRKSKQKYREALKRQESLLTQEEKLGQLRTEQQSCVEDQVQLALIDKALDFLDADEKYEQARHRVAAYPEGIENVTRHDVKEMDRLKDSLAATQKRKQSEQQKLEAARKSLHKCRLPEGGVDVELVSSLRRKCQRLEVQQEELQRKREELEGLEAELAQASQEIGPKVSVEQADSLDSAAVQQLFQLVRQVESVRAEKQVAETLSDWLGGNEQSEETDPLGEGVQLLLRWLAVEGSASLAGQRNSMWIAAAGGATLILAVVMAFAAHISWLLILAAGIGLLAWAFWPKKVSDHSAEIRRDYESLQLGGPPSWSDADVRNQIRQLQKRRDKAAIAQEKQVRWNNLGPRRKKLAEKAAAMEQMRQKWTRCVGLDTDEAQLSLLVASISRFQQVRQKLTSHAATIEASTNQFEILRTQINEALALFGIAAVDDPDQLAAHVEELARRQQAHELASQTIEDCTSDLNQIDEDIDAIKGELETLFERVQLTPDQEPTLRRWAGQRAEYDQALNEQRIAEAARDSLQASLAEHRELLQLSREELLLEQQRCTESAKRLSDIGEEIGGIGKAIAIAQQGTDVMTALAEEVACADALREKREQDCDAVVGDVLARFIDRQERDSELPVILRRARELFARITHGRYELHVQPGDPPQFRAKDTAVGVGLSLDELSSGTRLQLLLAVRVAFVERQEQGVKVPLILDETLGNSDERRAREIIDAAIEICRDGRQVFYFTAQHDEVGKWRQFLDSCNDVPHRFVDLAEVRKFSESERIPAVEYERPEPIPVPSPDGLDWLEYGQRLSVPRPDPESDVGDCHLWYVIDDLPTLHGLLSNGINKWGQFRTLVSHGRVDGVSSDSDLYHRAEAATRVLLAVKRNWKIGRGKPVDRNALLESGAVSPTFIDRLTELAAELGGDGKALIRALEAGELPGFRTDKRLSLEEFLIDKGHIDERDVLSLDQITGEVRMAVYTDLEQGLIQTDRIELLTTITTATDAPDSPVAELYNA